MSNLNSEFGRRCINNKNVQYFVEQEICIKRHDTGNRMAFKLDEIEFSDPEIDTKIINKIKEFLNA